jgi:hypothetical protein
MNCLLGQEVLPSAHSKTTAHICEVVQSGTKALAMITETEEETMIPVNWEATPSSSLLAVLSDPSIADKTRFRLYLDNEILKVSMSSLANIATHKILKYTEWFCACRFTWAE